MNPIKRRITKSTADLRAAPALPTWVLGLAAVVIVVVIFATVIDLARSHAPSLEGAELVPLGASNVAAPPATDPAPPATDFTFVELTVLIEDPNGATVEVPQTAVFVARQAATAIFTGQFEQVPTLADATVPVLPATFPTPTVTNPTLRGAGDGVWTFGFLVEPDQDGPEPLRRIDVAVVSVDGVWMWTGV